MGNCRASVTIVIVGKQLASTIRRNLYALISVSAMISAIAAFAIPGRTGNPAEIAAVLAVGAIAMMAGHGWGLLVVTSAELLLLGTIWPTLAFPPDHGSAAALATYTAVVAALPGLVLLGPTLPQIAEVLLGARSGRTRPALAGVTVLAAIALVLPGL